MVRVLVRAVGLLGAVAGLLWAGAVPATGPRSRWSYRGRVGTLTAEGTGTFGVERLTVRLR